MKTTMLNKFLAACYLQKLYEETITVFKLEDTQPDFYSLITENTRNPLSLDAIDRGYPRGNRHTYTCLEFVRISNRPMFFKSKLKEWFMSHYWPKMLKAV